MAQAKEPSLLSLAMKTSELLPDDVRVVLPKLALPEKVPVISAEPSLSAAMP